MQAEDLVQGAMYLVTYQCPERGVHRVARQTICKFIGFKNDKKELHFSGRPTYGDASIPVDWFIDAVMVKSSMRPTHPETLKGFDAYAR